MHFLATTEIVGNKTIFIFYINIKSMHGRRSEIMAQEIVRIFIWLYINCVLVQIIITFIVQNSLESYIQKDVKRSTFNQTTLYLVMYL